MMVPIQLELPVHLHEQIDGKRRRIICSWEEWWDWGEFILSRQNIRRVLLTDWPPIDLPDVRRLAEIEVMRSFGGNQVRTEVLPEADECYRRISS